jgi:hypothetical protein
MTAQSSSNKSSQKKKTPESMAPQSDTNKQKITQQGNARA